MIIAENPTLPSENIENQTIPTSVMHSTANITEPIGQNTINLEVSINEAVTKFLSYLIFLHSWFVGVCIVDLNTSFYRLKMTKSH